jgi:hypothetical protein
VESSREEDDMTLHPYVLELLARQEIAEARRNANRERPAFAVRGEPKRHTSIGAVVLIVLVFGLAGSLLIH